MEIKQEAGQPLRTVEALRARLFELASPETAIVFDIGRVLFDYDSSEAHARIARMAGCSPAHVEQTITSAGRFEAYGRGEITCEEFAYGVMRDLGLRLPPLMFLYVASAMRRTPSGVAEIIPELEAAAHSVNILSNTCKMFNDSCERDLPKMLRLVPRHRYFMSNEIGLLKPTAACFEFVKRSVGAERFVMVDDLLENCLAARASGYTDVWFDCRERS